METTAPTSPPITVVKYGLHITRQVEPNAA